MRASAGFREEAKPRRSAFSNRMHLTDGRLPLRGIETDYSGRSTFP
jgi:hypothetical protein